MSKLLKIFLTLCGIAILCVVSLIAVTQTPWFKSRLEKTLHDLAQESGFSLSIGHLRGSIPLRWKISDLYLHSPDDFTIKVDSLRFRVSLFLLLKKEIGISSLKVNHLIIHPGKENSQPPEKFLFDLVNDFPFNLSIRSFKMESISLVLPEVSFPIFSLKGTAKIKKNGYDILLKLILQTADTLVEEDLFVFGGSRKGILEIIWKNRIASLQSITTPLSLPYDTKMQSQLNLKGPWQTWRAIALKENSSTAPLVGRLFARVDDITIPDFEGLDHAWKIRSSFRIHANRFLDIEKGTIQGDLATLHCKELLYGEGTPIRGEYSLDIPSLNAFSQTPNKHLTGSLKATGRLEKEAFNGQFQIDGGQWGSLHFSSLKGSMDLARISQMHPILPLSLKNPAEDTIPQDQDLSTKAPVIWTGGLTLHLDEQTLHLEGSSKLVYVPRETLSLTGLEFTAPSFKAAGDLVFDQRTLFFHGAGRIQADDLTKLDLFFPDSELGGMVGAELRLLHHEGQSLHFHVKGTNLQMKHLQIADGTLDADLHFLSDKPTGVFDVYAERIYLPEIYLASIDLHLSSDSSSWRFSTNTEGTWKESFQINASGNYLHSAQTHTVHFDNLQGTFLSQRFALEHPNSITVSTNSFFVSETSFQLGQGHLTGQFFSKNEQWKLGFQGNDVPLSWLTLFTSYLSLQGETNIHCTLEGDANKVFGSCGLTLKELQAKRFGAQPLSQVKGSLMAHFEGKRMQLHSEFHANEGQVVLFDASVPLELHNPSHFPFGVAMDAPWSSSLLIEGKLEELSEFFNTGFHHWKGWVEGKILLSGSLRTPQMLGNIFVHQGTYENDFIGLHLENIEAALQATRDEILLTSLEATGMKQKGHLKATGNLRLRSDYDFPYRFSATLDRLKTIRLDMVEATLTGSTEIDGTLKKTNIRGVLDIDNASFSPPRNLPDDLPDLPVTFVNQPSHVEANFATLAPPFPLHIDITFHAKDAISFDASGLTSVWGGDLHLHGLNSNLLANGTLRLVRGQFTLLGKTFQLNQGEISFSDKPGQQGLLNISGILNMNDVTITASLRGALTSPQLSLQSVPPLTTSDIFSLILFNKKVTEIKPMQAVQLAHTILSLSGSSGWNFVGQIGGGLNILGIDTFDIIPSEEGLNQTSITIGKHFYFVRGVLVSLTQSLTSSRFIVEVDLGGGVLFQAENQSGDSQSQQIGKLSLKWNKNY
ncbi:MAG: translocation/assembly module TamB domain-containing protein [Simkania sp.]|nr:translocation/assembly module TamB domain-containing protein [Simkania sp.]